MAAIEVSHDGDILHILLNRPEKRNALRDEDFIELADAAKQVSASSARAVLISGAGDAFCSGRDISAMDVSQTDAERLINETINPTFLALRSIAIPTIAMVQGACVGGGFGIAFACDMVLAADDARIGSPFRNLGFLPDSGIHFHLLQTLGYHRTCELLYTGRLLSGREAAQMGLINGACPRHELANAAKECAAAMANGPTTAFIHSKRILQQHLSFQSVLHEEAVGQGRVFQSADAKEGVTAFQQKRMPRFRGI